MYGNRGTKEEKKRGGVPGAELLVENSQEIEIFVGKKLR